MAPNPTDRFPPSYDLRIENFGKLAAAEIRLGDFTVLAGPNNTGKSFVSKLLYSIFSALDADLPRARVSRLVSSLARQVRRVSHSVDDRPTTSQLERIAEDLSGATLSYASGEVESLDSVVTQIHQSAAKMAAVADRMTPNAPGAAGRTQRLLPGLSDLRESFQQLATKLDEAVDRRAFSLAELQYRTVRALRLNFQVADLASLAGNPEGEIAVEVAGLLQLTARGNNVDLKAGDVLPVPPTTHNVVYLESPIYWKLFDALQSVRRFTPLFSRPGRERLTSVPGYFYDLAETIGRKYTGGMAFPEVHRQLVGNDAIGGKVTVSETGDIVFEEAGRSFPLVTAAAGVANMGFLAMLIERKVIDHGTMLFIDEPEAHLHPAWQVVVADALFQLARQGVRVVLATHSVDILKWLEVHLKMHPDEEQHVALNRFPSRVVDTEDIDTKLASIKDDLTKPFVDLYLRGL